MISAPSIAVVGPDLATERSADAGPTVLVIVTALLPNTGSVVPVETVAVLVTRLPAAVDDGVFTTNTYVLLVFVGIEPMVQVRSPVAPTAGTCEQLPWVNRTNVVPAGTLSLTTVLVAVLGPPFVAVTV